MSDFKQQFGRLNDRGMSVNLHRKPLKDFGKVGTKIQNQSMSIFLEDFKVVGCFQILKFEQVR